MRRIFLILIILLLKTAVTTQAQTRDDVEAAFSKLDSVIDASPHYVAVREGRISRLRARLKGTRNLKSRYEINMQLYEEYRAYKNDSAIVYLDNNFQLAKRMKRKDLEGDCLSLIAYQSSTVGRYPDASAMLSQVDVSQLRGKGLFHYFRAQNHLYSEIGYYSHIKMVSDNAYAISSKYEALMLKSLDKRSTDYKQYLCRLLYNKGDLNGAMKVCDEWQKMVPDTAREFAIVAYWKYLIYLKLSDFDKSTYWVTQSAISDISHAVMDQASLWSLADYISGRDIDRSYKYITFAWKCASIFGTQVRSAQISPVLSAIQSEYKDKLDKANTRLTLILGVITVLAIVLLFMIYFLSKQSHRLSDARNNLKQRNDQLAVINGKLEETNGKLEESNSKLKDANSRIISVNGQLKESDQIKEAYIGRFLALCSEYVDRMDSDRKKASKMLKEHKNEDLYRMLRSTEQKEQDVEELYGFFDSTFLNIFPSFVEDFNSLLKPEARVSAPKGKLNTTLRIFALIRLGIDDSGKIADFLHYSVNTIYNYRARTKNGCIGNRDTFEEEVKKLGKI